jgi:site-specific DNA recombinase
MNEMSAEAGYPASATERGEQPKMKALIYARTATKVRTESSRSIRAQTDAARQYAQANGFDIAEVFTDAESLGTRLERPGLNKMRRMIARDSIDAVVVRDFSRLSRSVSDTLTLERVCQMQHTSSLCVVLA